MKIIKILAIILGTALTVLSIDFITSEIKPFKYFRTYSITQDFICKNKGAEYIYIKATPETCCWCNSDEFGGYECMRAEDVKAQNCG